ncbi:MAG: serine/threonine protein kinase [Polyangiaceae bacterium]|nr:serine/threonine protein kinase [Polyangiaceae bacterium]
MAAVSAVRNIGRYEVAGHLATGGMAEILLGRVVGPAGFERAVVLKRILPHLARERAFVEMFLDEARVAARIRHPNVVQVHELLHEEDELCIVMEYLEGESLSSVMRRLQARGRRLEPALCAHVIAQAAAGLHAAHELCDADGNELMLVHRDVSPQNIFVGYDGSTKVLDFGIAVMRDRSQKTQTGQLRGKYEYMSPEQCASRPLDRRSDLFSLGVVLYELSTGTHLFRRRHELLVLRAIVEEPVPPPRDIIERYPEVLERVVLNALEKGRSERYQTAAEMRRELLGAARALGGSDVPDEQLAPLMNELFADRRLEKEEMLRRLQSGSDLLALPAAEADEAVELPLVTELRPVTAGMRPSVPAVHRARWHWVAVALGTGVALLGGGWSVVSRTARLRDELGPSSPDPSVSLTIVARPSEPPPATSTRAPASALVTVQVESSPSDAEVFLRGKEVGRTPVLVSVVRGEEVIELELRRDGYRTLRESIRPDVAQRIRLVLEPAPAPRRPVPKPASGEERYRRFN